MQSSGSLWMWVGFLIFVIFMISIDIFLLKYKKSHKVTVKEALTWVMVWFTSALIFNGLIWLYFTHTHGLPYATQKALEFFSGYLIEQSLSVDNMFAFIMIFSFFKVPEEYQHRVLIYGVLSAIVMRFLVILGGTWLVHELHWILYVFGAFLVFTGLKMLVYEDDKKDLSENTFLQWLRRHLRVTNEYHQENFFIKHKALWYATPLFLVLIFIELSDLIFALDSIPAIFAITNDAFIIFTSNIFAILGLRSLYFLLANMAARFHLLRYGIALMLVFIGVKMLIEPWIHIPILIALCVVVAILGTTVLLSLYIPPRIRKL
jgi:tellurite resistance protein TerC